MLALSALDALRCRFALLLHISTERCLLSFPARLNDAQFFFFGPCQVSETPKGTACSHVLHLCVLALDVLTEYALSVNVLHRRHANVDHISLTVGSPPA
jgi:hypothetical protein